MAFFSYRARDQSGEESRGLVEAPTQAIATETLLERGLVVLGLEEQAQKSKLDIKIPFLGDRVKVKDIVIFSRQFAVMASANLPVVQAFRILIKQTASNALRIVLSDVADEVEGGARLSLALSKHPEAFSDFYISMVRSGETAGKLEEVLNFLADQMEKDFDLMSKIKGAMTYPAFIMGGLVLVGTIMMVFVVPKLTEILSQSGAQLPWTTRSLITVSTIMKKSWWIVGIVGLFSFFGGKYYIGKYPRARYIWDLVKLRLPLFGPLIFQKIYVVRFTRSLSTLLLGGVTLTQSLHIVSDVVGNAVYKKLIEDTIKEVEDGNSIATVFLQSKHMPVMVSQLLIVGEQTGRLDDILTKLSNFYTREVDNSVGNLVTLIEPLVLLLMGGAVGIMVSAILLPLYNLASNG